MCCDNNFLSDASIYCEGCTFLSVFFFLPLKCQYCWHRFTYAACGVSALLTVNDDEFWDGVSPVEFGSLPVLQDAVTVVGYPIGGDTISVTSGVVSRMEILSYVHGATELLGLQVCPIIICYLICQFLTYFQFVYLNAKTKMYSRWFSHLKNILIFSLYNFMQIDAAINSGNSGGPAFNDKGQCVGIAFQSLKHEDVENIGYVIPTPVIMHFIKDYEKSGEYTGKIEVY